jgi:hypothetical protein
VINELRQAVAKAADQYVMASVRLEKCEKDLRIANQKVEDVTALLHAQREVNQSLTRELAKSASRNDAYGNVKRVDFRREGK